MDTDTAEGTLKEAAVEVQDAVGGVVGDAATQISAKARDLSGQAQQLCADTTSLVRDRTAESPFAVLGIVAAASFIAGVTWANSRNVPSRAYAKNSGADDRAY
jgi:uncharacterized protein YjbJ (UPF0337 family)